MVGSVAPGPRATYGRHRERGCTASVIAELPKEVLPSADLRPEEEWLNGCSRALAAV